MGGHGNHLILVSHSQLQLVTFLSPPRTKLEEPGGRVCVNYTSPVSTAFPTLARSRATPVSAQPHVLLDTILSPPALDSHLSRDR